MLRARSVSIESWFSRSTPIASLVLHVEAEILDPGFLLAELRFGLSQLRHRGGQIIRHARVGIGQVGKLPAKGAGGIGLLPQHGLGFEQARLDLRIGANEVVDRFAEQREIVLQASDFLEPVDQIGKPHADQLVLLADRVELSVGARRRRLFSLSGGRLLVAQHRRVNAVLAGNAGEGILAPLAEARFERRPTG